MGSFESKEFVTGDSLKAKKLRMTLSRRRRAKANTGGRPRLSYFNTLLLGPTSTEHKENLDLKLNEFLDISFQSQGFDSRLTRTAFKS